MNNKLLVTDKFLAVLGISTCIITLAELLKSILLAMNSILTKHINNCLEQKESYLETKEIIYIISIENNSLNNIYINSKEFEKNIDICKKNLNICKKILNICKRLLNISLPIFYISSICILTLYPFINIKIDYSKLSNTCTFLSTGFLFLSISFNNYINEEKKKLNCTRKELNYIRELNKYIKTFINKK